MPNLNTIAVGGHAGKDAEVTESRAGKQITRVSIAVKSGWGENESTTWVKLTVFGGLGKFIQSTKKGDYVQVVGGEMSLETWGDNNEHSQVAITAGVGAACLVIPKGTYKRRDEPAPEPTQPEPGLPDSDQDLPF